MPPPPAISQPALQSLRLSFERHADDIPLMVWDLRRALLAKEEFESARLTDFEFREIVRAVKLLAAARNAEVHPVLDMLAEAGLDAALALLGSGEHTAEFMQARAEARRRLIAERGDPTPHRLG